MYRVLKDINDLCLNASLFSWAVNRLGFSLTNNNLFSTIVLMQLTFNGSFVISYVAFIHILHEMR